MKLYDLFMLPLEKMTLAKIRKNIITKAYGKVLEIGYGTGVNFKYYNAKNIEYLSALDIKRGNVDTTQYEYPIKFYEGQIAKLPFQNDFFDTVVETLVFCHIDDQLQAINEILRVLKPGGSFIFIEHVLPSKKGLAVIFKVTNVIWTKVAQSCSLTRETHKLFEKTDLKFTKTGCSHNGIFRWGIARKHYYLNFSLTNCPQV